MPRSGGSSQIRSLDQRYHFTALPDSGNAHNKLLSIKTFSRGIMNVFS